MKEEKPKPFWERMDPRNLVLMLLLLLLALLFISGETLIFGIKDSELTEITLPKNILVGLILFWIAFDLLLPKKLSFYTIIQKVFDYIKKKVKGEQ